jgi:hypothetical protein
MNFIVLLSCYDCWNVQLTYEDICAILATSYAESYNTKVVDNGILYHLVDLEIFSCMVICP